MFERLAHYNILGPLGAGGLGALYRARDTRHGRTVALRVLDPSIRDDDERRLRFLRDAERAATLSHPNIATLYEVGEDDGQLFAAFEFVPGDSLKSLIAAGPINPRRAVQAAAQIADALAEGHSRGLTHGALDRDHVIITPKGNAKVLDFGLSSWRSRAPGTGGLDQQDDLCALGVLLQDMARGGSASDARGIMPSIDRIIAKTLCDDPEERYESAAMLAADLRAAADEAVSQRPDMSDIRQSPPANLITRREPRTARLAVIIAVVAVFSGAAWAVRGRLTTTWRRAVAQSPRPVIVLVPFERSAGSPDYFSNGFAQDLAGRLGQIPGVQVVGRTSPDGATPAAHDLARAVNAGVMLTGNVRLIDGNVTVAIRLLEPSTNDAIWHGEFTRDTKDVFPLQAQIADDVARAIGVGVTPTAAGERAAVRLVDPTAYDDYLHGRQTAAEGDFADAETLLRRAVETDDGLAEAHALLAATLSRLASLDGPLADAQRQRAKRAAARAVELGPDLPAASLAAATTADSFGDAMNALKTAIRYDSSYADAYREVADQIADLDSERAAKFRRRAVALDPALASAMSSRLPWPADSCEAAALQRPTDADGRLTRTTRERLVMSVERGAAADAGPHAMRCAAISAAALGNAASASASLRRIAADEAALWVWSTHAGGLTGTAVMGDDAWPWSRISGHPALAAARTELDAAFAKARRQIAAALGDITF